MKSANIFLRLIVAISLSICFLLFSKNSRAADLAAFTGLTGNISSAVLFISVSVPPELQDQTGGVWVALVRNNAIWFHNGNTFQPYLANTHAPPVASGRLSGETQVTLPESDLRDYESADIYVGVGLDFNEMLQVSRYTNTGSLSSLTGTCDTQTLAYGVSVSARFGRSNCSTTDGQTLGSLYRFAGNAGQTATISYQGSGMSAIAQLRTGNALVLSSATVPSEEMTLQRTDLFPKIFTWNVALPQTGFYDVFVAGPPGFVQFCSSSVACLRQFNELKYEIKLVALTGGSQALVAQRGGMDLIGYCKLKGYSTAVTIGTDINSWKCQDTVGSLFSIDVTDVCSVQYRGTRPYAAFSNFFDSSSWYCTNDSP